MKLYQKVVITTIAWDDNNYFSLKQLVAARIAHYLNEPIPTDFRTINNYWNMLYPVNIYYNGKPNYLNNYIINRTFQRPRELLQFCRLILESSKKNYLPVEEGAISPAEIQYSNWKLNDLSGEYSKACKNIDKCILSFVGTSKKWDWDCPSLLVHLEQIDETEKLINPITDEKFSSKETISFLYQIGFFRKVIDEPGKRRKYRMFYQDETINYQKTVFDIHPAFRKKFTIS